MPTPATLEVTLKFAALPDAEPAKNGWHRFALDAGGIVVTVSLRPKAWAKLEAAAQRNHPGWVAVITGQMGPRARDGFTLAEPVLVIFEKKPKDAAQDGAPEPAG